MPNDPIVQRSKSFRVLDVRGTGARSTEFGVPPVGCAKQRWLVHGQVVSPSAAELWRLKEWDAAGAVDYAIAAFPPSDARATLKTRQTPGKGISKRVAAAVARRTLQRGALLAAVLAGTVQCFDTSLEHALGSAMRSYEPLEGAALVFVVAIAWIGEGPRVLVNERLSALPSALSDSHAPRKSALAMAERLLAGACPERRPRGVMVSDLKWCRIVAAPLAFHAPSQLNFGDTRWARLSELNGSPLAAPAARAMGVVASYVSLDSPLRMPPPVLPGGARAAQYVPQPPPRLATDAAHWDAQVATDAAACDALRLKLSALADTDPDGEWFAGWADQVDSGNRDEVPPELRRHDVDFSDPVYANTPFAYRDAVPTTVPAPVSPPQNTDYKPRNLCPDIFPTEVQARWEKWWLGVLSDLKRYALNGGEAKREFNAPFIVALSELHPEPVGTVHDYYEPADFSARLVQRPLGTPRSPSEVSTHLGITFLEDEWADYDDQEMVAMATRTGVDFLIDATERQLVVFPHLVSLPTGFASVQKELSRPNGLKFNEFCGSFPFVPFQSLPQGATRHEYEDRDRRTTKGGSPRNEATVDVDGSRVFPLNVAIGANNIVGQTTWRLPGLPATTGFPILRDSTPVHRLRVCVVVCSVFQSGG